ncbi:PD-(D/E)XK nuclease family protein, partial [Fructobacillus ficulneus]
QAYFQLFDHNSDPDHPGFDQDAQVNRRLNYLKRFIKTAFDDIQAGFDQAKTLSEGARFLLGYLKKYQVTQAVLNQRDQLIAAGDLVKAQQVMEVWQLFVNILDQVVQVAGDQAFDREVFLAALQAGFAGGKFTGIPNQLDQLTVSEAGIVQSQNYKVLYFIGGTRTALPAQAKNKSVLTDQDRLLVQPALADQETPRYLHQTAAQQMAEENLVFYGALQAAADKVVLSYPLLNQEGKANEMSPYYSRLANFFDLPVQKVTGRPETVYDLAQQYLGTPEATLSQVAKLADLNLADPNFKTLYRALDQAGLQEKTDRVLAGRTYQNQVTDLRADLAQALFSQPLSVSISQIETYYRNPYEYFLQYGLRLQERPTAELDAASTGIIYHDIFEKAVQNLIDQGQSLRDLDQAEIKNLVTEELDRLIQEPEFAELKEDFQGQAVADYLAETAEYVLTKLYQAAGTNQSQPDRVETLFGFPQGDLGALKLTAGSSDLVVRGKIDRFDLQDGQGDFGTLVDYKTSAKTFSYADAVAGLQLQLLTYWQAAPENAA